MRTVRVAAAGAAVLGVLAGGVAGASVATAESSTGTSTGGGIPYERVERLGPGVEYREFSVAASHGTVHGHVLVADLRNPRTKLDLLTPGQVTARQAVSGLADARHAVGAVNGDFFNITEDQHPGVPPPVPPRASTPQAAPCICWRWTAPPSRARV